MRALQGGTLGRVAASMVPAFPGGNISHITTFMPSHPAFSRAQQFLDQLFTRSCPPSIRSDIFHIWRLPPYNDQRDTPQDQIKKAIASMMGIWPDQVQGFGRALHFPWFQLKQASVHFLASHHVARAHLVWIELENLEPTEAMPEGEGPAVWEDDQGRGDSQARIPLKAVASFLSLERPGKAGVCVNLSLSPAPGPPPGLQSTPEPEDGSSQGEYPVQSEAPPWPGLA
ncbi:LOW QUALITY PROTEIN: hypothetical protein QTO34_018222 [Cnephaeus nilssonii]|uniref:Uncharacterized protein n=1 Tax=Cnephaeus nilssonii TaxID=3371016 RepID=A0AA40HYH4_CNENI|nr:LOW QUALITY PROTEIN: hypothetical protein QTO34_018222 [Eptesicus nilssonii]